MQSAARGRSDPSRPGVSREPGLPPGARSGARSLEQLQREAQASGACASSQSPGSAGRTGARADHAQELGPRDSVYPVVTVRPLSPASTDDHLPVIHLFGATPVSFSTGSGGVDSAVRARPVSSETGRFNPLFEAADAVLRTAGASAASAPSASAGRSCSDSTEEESASKARRSGASRREAATHGGFYYHPRTAFRAAGHTLLSGSKRSCIPDCVSMLLHEHFQVVLPLGAFDSVYVGDLDPSFRDVGSVLLKHGFTLDRVTSTFMRPGGVEVAVLSSSGLHLLHLALEYADDRLGPEARRQFHCYAYDGCYLRDNDRYTRPVEVVPSDFADKSSARAVFAALFDRNTSVRLHNVYSLRRV